ncbi:MAG TPA: hypothetical protein VF211_15895 [Burkholderiales bacterium]
MPDSHPFASLADSLPPLFMQVYVIAMAVLVAAGTLYDVVHKGSARYFFTKWRQSGRRSLGGGALASVALRTALVDVLASGEFCNARRRIAHLLTMYGFLLYVLGTVVMVFDASAGALWLRLWWLGALMVCVGGYWFWFFIRVDVAAEGNSPLRVVRADLFILSLVASATLALVWAAAGGGAGVLFWAYLAATTVLFGSVPWSKFAHMFFKPAAALEKRLAEAAGTRDNLPAPADRPEQLGRRVRHARNY